MNDIILTCPSCATRYKSDASSIGPNGRTVRCAKCGEVWFQPSPEVDSAPDIEADALAHADNQDHSVAPETAQDANLPDVSDQQHSQIDETTAPDHRIDGGFASIARTEDGAETETETEAAGPSEVAPLPAVLGADVMMRDRADQMKLARRKRIIAFIWLVPLIIVLLAAFIAWTQRQAIVNRIPQMATLYQALGAEVRAGGLKLDPPVAQMRVEDGVSIIRIESLLHNLTNDTLPVPLIELTLHDEMGQSLTQWYVEPSETEIAPKAKIPISTDYAEPPAGAVGVRYRLMNESAA